MRAVESGQIASNSTNDASTAFVETGEIRNATSARLHKSIAIVNSTPTQRNVIGSIANTSDVVVSSSRYSPGRVATSPPYGAAGRFARRPVGRARACSR